MLLFDSWFLSGAMPRMALFNGPELGTIELLVIVDIKELR